MIRIDDDALHVWWCWSPTRYGKGYWKATGREGDYGISDTRPEAIATAVSAAASSYGRRPIVIHDEYFNVIARITRVRVKPASQFFQDSVP
jgi:hypothetical protein